MSNQIDLSAILSYCQKATPGPWEWGGGTCVVLCCEGIINRKLGDVGNIFVNCGRGSGDPIREDVTLLTNSRADLPAVTEALIEALRLLDCAPSDDAPADVILWAAEVRNLFSRFTGWEDKGQSV